MINLLDNHAPSNPRTPNNETPIGANSARRQLLEHTMLGCVLDQMRESLQPGGRDTGRADLRQTTKGMVYAQPDVPTVPALARATMGDSVPPITQQTMIHTAYPTSPANHKQL